MKNYETGICQMCGERKEAIYHITNDSSRFPLNLPPHDFKDSGIAQLEMNAPKLLEALEFAREFHMLDDPDGEPFTLINEAINEALKQK